MKTKIILTTVFSILTVLCIATCIFALCNPMGIPEINNPVKVSESIQVEYVDGDVVISGKIKNKTDETITLQSQCLVISLYNSLFGGTYLHVTTKEPITIDAKKEFDLSSVELEYEEYDYIKSNYKWGYSYVVDAVTVYLSDYDPEVVLVYSKLAKEEGQIIATFSAILGVIFAIVTILVILPYIISKRRYTVSKKRFDVAKQSLAQVENGVYLRGAFCQKKTSIIKPSKSSRIKGTFKALTMGVIINTRYLSAEVMDFIITERGFYVAPAKSNVIDVKEMEFFDKEELDKSQIVSYKDNVVLNPLFHDSYFVFDLSQSMMTPKALIELLNKMFEEDDGIQHVDFDENSAQKNI